MIDGKADRPGAPRRIPPKAHAEGMHALQNGALFNIPLADLHPNDVRAALGLYAAKLGEAQKEIDRLSTPNPSGLILPPGARG